MKHTLGAFFSVRSLAFFWYSREQISIELSSVEVEYMVEIQATCEAIWIREILVGLFG